MKSFSSSQVLKLYKDLLRYGQELRFTDKEYFYNRIRREFISHRDITDPKKINFHYEGAHPSLKEECPINKSLMHMWRRIGHVWPNFSRTLYRSYCKSIDYSKVPQLQEGDLQEQFVRGSGPGGQATNKTANCVVLKHLPTGIVVKCHETRSLDQNRKKARSLLTSKLDNLINGEGSVENQLKIKDNKKSANANKKKEKLRALKEEWKRRENLD